MARLSDQISLGVLKPPMQAGVNTVGRYLTQNRVMLILMASWSVIILIAVLAMLSLLNPAAVNPIPSPTPELQVERPPEAAPTEPTPTEFENPRALWSLFTAMAAAGCIAGALIILLGLRRALIQNAIFHPSAAKSPRKAPVKVPKTPAPPTTAKQGQTRPAKAPPKSTPATVKAAPGRFSRGDTKRTARPPARSTPQPATAVVASAPHPGSTPIPLPLVPPPVPGQSPGHLPNGNPAGFVGGDTARFSRGDAARSQPTATVHIVPSASKRPPKDAKAAKAKAAKARTNASPSPKPVAHAPVVVTQAVPPSGGVPPSPPVMPKVASLQKAAQKKAARKQATAQQASAQQQAGKPPRKGHQPAQAARQGNPPPILSSLQAGVTIVPAEQTHPLDWHENGIAEAMDMRKRRPLSSLMMRRR